MIKFIHSDRDKVKKSGMNDSDIKYFEDTAKEKAQERLKDIIANQTAPQDIKKEAQEKLKELETL